MLEARACSLSALVEALGSRRPAIPHMPGQFALRRAACGAAAVGTSEQGARGGSLFISGPPATRGVMETPSHARPY